MDEMAPIAGVAAYVLNSTDHQEPLARATDLRAWLRKNKAPEGQLLVIHGLPWDFHDVLEAESNIDPYFFEAHIRRRPYRPTSRKAGDLAHITIEYPELVQTRTQVLGDYLNDERRASSDSTEAPDLFEKPPIYSISNSDGAVFCRASLWLSADINVLLMDRLPWNSPRRDYLKMQKPDSVLRALQRARRNPVPGPETGIDTPCVETLLNENLPWLYGSFRDATPLLEEIAIRQWLDFFDELPATAAPGSPEVSGLYLQVNNSLERNLASSLASKASDAKSEWEALLARNTRRSHLLSQLNPVIASFEVPRNPDEVQFSLKPQRSNDRLSKDWRPDSGRTASNKPSRQPSCPGERRSSNVQVAGYEISPNSTDAEAARENRRSLDRVSYMGGILLPFSIVSGIFGMEEPFQPGKPLFYVFWATAAPLVLLALFVVYADSIRKSEVWVEVAAHDPTGHHRRPSTAKLQSPSALEQGPEPAPFAEVISFPVSDDGGETAAGTAEEVAVPVAACPPPPPDRLAQSRLALPIAEPEINAPPTGMVLKKLFPGTKAKVWRKEELGWLGACATALGLYKLQKSAPRSPAQER
ncbi:hypothetical protein F4780DRAFT_722337 [Xylariomycetidae sp. FL0641]|nr:hypothetical protein F4780DRAFT_722337 [Xylariomycetidae sp. FL0641]